MKILVVDDQAGMRETLIDILEEVGYEVEAAVDGYGAIEKAEEQFFDIILIDIIMPGINGVEAIREIKKTNKKWDFSPTCPHLREALPQFDPFRSQSSNHPLSPHDYWQQDRCQ